MGQTVKTRSSHQLEFILLCLFCLCADVGQGLLTRNVDEQWLLIMKMLVVIAFFVAKHTFINQQMQLPVKVKPLSAPL